MGGAVTFSQSTDAPDGFANSLKVQCSTTNTSITTNQYVSVSQRIEAQDLQQLGYGTASANSITLSWRMKSTVYTGPITVALQTADGTAEYYVKSYTPTTGWAEYTCVIPPSTTATINNDSGEGLRVSFILAGDSGSSIAVSSDSAGWSTTRTDYRSDVGNILSSTSNSMQITGVQLEVGDTATPFEHRSYGDELLACKRYFQRIAGGESGITGSAIMTGIMHNSTFLEGIYKMEVEMRTEPTLERVAGTDYYGFSRNGAQDTFNSISIDAGIGNPRQVNLYNATEVSGTAGQGGIMFSKVEAAIVSLSAEL
ncbi:hypothetical protein N8247_00050 [bacterium]|nr:hypothetical protein [bacterium]